MALKRLSERSRRTWTRRARTAILFALFLGTGVAWAASPPKPWVSLASGSDGSYHWWVEIKRPAGAGGIAPHHAERPCLLVGNQLHASRFSLHRSTYRTCTRVTDHLRASGPPLIAMAEQPSNGGPVKMTTVGMVFDRSVLRVRVQLGSGVTTTIHPEQLSPQAARGAGLARLRYSAFSVTGGWCAEHLISESASGTVLWEGGPMGAGCGAEGG